MNKIIAFPLSSWPSPENCIQASHNFDFMLYWNNIENADQQAMSEFNRIQAMKKNIHCLLIAGCLKVYLSSSNDNVHINTGIAAISSIILTKLVEKYLPGYKEHFIPMPQEYLSYSKDDIPKMISYINTIAKTQVKRALTVANYEEKNTLNSKKNTFESLFKIATNSSQSTHIIQAKEALNELILTTNQVLSNHPNDYRYPNDQNDAFSTYEDALSCIQKIIEDPQIDYIDASGKTMPAIPKISFKTLKKEFPVALTNLLNDIHNSWGCDGYIDERTMKQVESKSSTPKMPGSIRCFHVDTLGALPNIQTLNTPSNALALETHLNNHAKLSHTMQKKTTSKQATGYAEYTGVGIKNDHHYSKIVFDYKTRKIYLTFTHYTRWGIGNPPSIKTPEIPGEQSAFILVDMTS